MNTGDLSKTGDAGLQAGMRSPDLIVYCVFLFSGLSALLYQITWQRALMLIYGSNTESVAIVVSSFLVGLGLGNLAGGKLSTLPKARPLLLFVLAELFIGLYGVWSVNFFRAAGQLTLHASPIGTGFIVFSLLLIPTLCMGATLPLLVALETNRSHHVGASVSRLYFVNTLGAGAGAFLSGFVLLGEVGLQGTVRVAALLNVLSVVVLLVFAKPIRRK